MAFTFSVITLNGYTTTVSVLGASNTIADIKAKLEELEAIPQAMIMLVHGGRKLEDAETLESCGIRAGVTINMVLALRAGV